MVESLNFQCPHCAIPLSLPASAAGIEGPCPRCGNIIIAPPPREDARNLPPHHHRRHEIESDFQPFAEHRPQRPTTRPAEPAIHSAHPLESTEFPPQDDAGQATPRSTILPQALILLCSILITAAISLTAGYLLGLRSGMQNSLFPAPPPSAAATISPAATETPEAATPAAPTENEASTRQESTEPEAAPKTAPPPEQPPATAAETAEAALKAFLDAPDWESRRPFILDADKLRSQLAKPSSTAADSPIAYLSLSPLGNPVGEDFAEGPLTFQVITSAHPRGFPVTIYPTADGWQLDFEIFLEIRDDLFRSFSDGPAGNTGTFHLRVSAPPPERAASTDNEHFSSFLITPPLPDRQQLAYVSKTNAAHAILRDATASGDEVPAVLDVAKRSTPDGKTFLEISSIIARDWTPPSMRK